MGEGREATKKSLRGEQDVGEGSERQARNPRDSPQGCKSLMPQGVSSSV